MVRVFVQAAVYPADTVRRRMQLNGSVGQQQICTRTERTVCRRRHAVKAHGPFPSQYASSTVVCAGCSISCRHSEEKNAAQRLCRSAANYLHGLPGLCAIHGADGRLAILLQRLHSELHQNSPQCSNTGKPHGHHMITAMLCFDLSTCFLAHFRQH